MEVYVRNPEEWTAFDVQVESQPNLISGEFFHAEEMRRECYPKGEKRVQQAGGNSTAKIIEEKRIGKLKEKRCSTEAGPSGISVHDNELEPLEEEKNDVAIGKELPMQIPLEFDDNEQMQPSADYLEGNEDEQMAGPSNGEGEENNQKDTTTNSDKKRQLMSEISSILDVLPMTADKCDEVLDRSGTNQSSRELIAEMLGLLQSPIPSYEKSETEHIREEEEERTTEWKEAREDTLTDRNDFLNQSSEPEDSEDSNLVEPAGQVVKERQKETHNRHQPTSESLFMNGLNITQRRDSGTDELQMEEEEQREKEQKGREEEEEETDDDEIIVIEQRRSTGEEKTKSGREEAFDETKEMDGEKEEKQIEEKDKEVQMEEEEKEAEQIGEEMEEEEKEAEQIGEEMEEEEKEAEQIREEMEEEEKEAEQIREEMEEEEKEAEQIGAEMEEEEKEAEQIGEEMEEEEKETAQIGEEVEEEEREVQSEGGENEEGQIVEDEDDDEEEEEEEEVVEDVIPADLLDLEDDESDKPLSDDSESRQNRQPVSLQFPVPTAVVPTFSGTAPPSLPAEPRPNIGKECRNSTPSNPAKSLQSDANIQTHCPKPSGTSKTQISTPSQSASNQSLRPAAPKLRPIIQKLRQQAPPQVMTPPASRKSSSITSQNTPSTSSRKPSDSAINQLNVSGATRKQQKSCDVTEKTQKVGNKSGRERDCWWLNTKDKKREKKKRRKEKERKRQESVANALTSQNASSSSSSVPPLSSMFCPSVSLPCQSVRSFPTEFCSAPKLPPCPPHPIPPPPSKMPDDVPPKPSEVYQIGTRFYFENSIHPITDVRLHPYVMDCKHLFTHGFCSYKTNCKFSHGAKQRTNGWMHAEHRAAMLERANRILAQPEVNQRLPLELSHSTSKSPTTKDNRVKPPAEGSCPKNSRSPSTERSRRGNSYSRHNSGSKSPMARSRLGNSRSRRRNSRSRHNLSSKSPTARSRPKTARSRSTARSRRSNSRSRLSNYRSRHNSGSKSPTARSRRSSSRHGSPAQYSRHNSSNEQHGAPMAYSVRSRSLIR
ncbi:hypothetical protein niasHS_012439 [Heterodera schachtii]|uniref:C3H1-type domain-containing protein n=1 Tax=Heterodera schachtii TaxID=97005 RepID=A0ABD2IJM9_HETSC